MTEEIFQIFYFITQLISTTLLCMIALLCILMYKYVCSIVKTILLYTVFLKDMSLEDGPIFLMGKELS